MAESVTNLIPLMLFLMIKGNAKTTNNTIVNSIIYGCFVSNVYF